MSLRKGSKLLQIVETDKYLIGCYHNTPVVELDRQSDLVTFRCNGWYTRSTASAQTLVIKDGLLLFNLKIGIRDGSFFLLNEDNKKLLEIYNGIQIGYNSLIAYNRGEV
jgi:hypothetical protein